MSLPGVTVFSSFLYSQNKNQNAPHGLQGWGNLLASPGIFPPCASPPGPGHAGLEGFSWTHRVPPWVLCAGFSSPEPLHRLSTTSASQPPLPDASRHPEEVGLYPRAFFGLTQQARVCSPGISDILGSVTLRHGGCPVYCGVPSSTPGLCPPDASSTSSPSYDNQKCPRHGQKSPAGENHPG